MLRRLRSTFAALAVFAFLLVPATVLAETAAPVPSPTEAQAGVLAGVTGQCWKNGTCSICDALVVFVNIANGILSLLAIVATIFFVYGAGLMMLSQGNEDFVKRGKDTMKATIVGVIITVGAWQIMSIVVYVIANGQSEGKQAVFEGSTASRGSAGGSKASYNPITSWYTAAQQCGK